jgi:hypothetical protein
MSPNPPADQREVYGGLLFGLGALCLAGVWVGLARVAYDVLVVGVLAGLLVKLLVLAVVYAFGVGLSTLGRGRFDQPLFARAAGALAWAFLGLIWLCYLGAILRVDSQQYSVLEYLSFVVVLAAGLLALGGLRLVTTGRPSPFFAVSLLVIVLFQLLLIVYRYVFASAPLSIFLVGNLALLIGMAATGAGMLGEDALRAFLERFIEKVG